MVGRYERLFGRVGVHAGVSSHRWLVARAARLDHAAQHCYRAIDAFRNRLLSLTCACIAFARVCVRCRYLQGRYLTAYYEPAAAPAAAAQSTGRAAQSGDSLLSPHFIVGFCMYATGMAINWQSDDILRNLRKPGETGYKIPRVR